ncbi:hypothetical protein V8E36_004213 [Tilletia maclaganii]
MLRIILLLCIAVLCSSITVPLKIANETVYFYANGTLDAEKIRHHIHYIQCHYQQSRTARSLCRFDAPLRKRRVESIELFSPSHAATPVGELRVGGQAFNAIFDTVRRLHSQERSDSMLLIDIGLLHHFAPFCELSTQLTLEIVPVTIVDPRAYLPETSPTARRVGEDRLTHIPAGGVSVVSRWRDVMTVGGIETITTLDRGENHMFDPTWNAAMGICAMSRYDSSSGGALSMIEVLTGRQLLDRPVFAFSLSRLGQTTQVTENGGILSLGYHRRSVRFSPLEQDPRYAGLWAISGHLNSISSRMILASGCPFIILPVQLARSIFDAHGLLVEEYGTALIAKYICALPPHFHIRFPAISVTLSMDSIMLGVDENDFCILSIIGAMQVDITLGLPFFRSAYVAFDLIGRAGRYGTPGRVGIGPP